MKRTCLLAVLLLATLARPPAKANGLQVEPVLLEMNAPAAAGTLALRNDDDADMAVQTRVFRWSQEAGVERLDPADDVAASPPIVTLAPGTNYTVRLVRTAKKPIRGEEGYRVVVDQLPDSRRQSESGVHILIRQSIPVFFRARTVTSPAVSWSLRQEAGHLLVTGKNTGDERLRVASLRLRDATGRTAAFGDGLVGYVLGHSVMTFTIPNAPPGFGASGGVALAAQSNMGAVHAMASWQTEP